MVKQKKTTQKHILFIVENNSIPRDVRVWNEALAATEFGYRVSVICPATRHDKKYFSRMYGMEIYRHPRFIEGSSKAGLIFEYLNALFWEYLLTILIFIRHPFHVIHAANPPDHIFMIALPFKLLGVKYLFDHHDICPENFEAKFGKNKIMTSLLYLFERLTFHSADAVISTNNSYKQIAIQRGRKKPESVFVVRNGPNLNKIRKMPFNPALKEGFDYMIAYVGVIGKQEGIENLIDSADYIVNTLKTTNIKFIVVGTGTHWNEIVSIVKKMKLEKYITLTGFIPDIKLYEILSSADVCINPEFRNEFTDHSTMIKIMEYLFFGKPIVQYYTTEGAVSAGEAAVYVKNNDPKEFADRLIELLHDPERRKNMGEIGEQRVHEELCWNRQKIFLKNAYEYLLSDGKQTGGEKDEGRISNNSRLERTAAS